MCSFNIKNADLLFHYGFTGLPLEEKIPKLTKY